MAIMIDLGTANSVTGIVDADGQAQKLPNAEGGWLTPSLAGFANGRTQTGKRLMVYGLGGGTFDVLLVSVVRTLRALSRARPRQTVDCLPPFDPGP